jgi:Bacterial pre-peptidase C-terminal domain
MYKYYKMQLNYFFLRHKLRLNQVLISLTLISLFTESIYAQGASCSTATPLTINGGCVTGHSISNATQDAPNIGTCTGTFAREGWYTFTVTGGPALVTITADSANRNLFLQLISSTSSCNGLTQIDCANADNTTNSAQTETITQTLNNGTYYIKVVNVGSSTMTLNSLCVTSSTPCVAPVSQATGFATGTLTSTSFPASFTGTAVP